MMSNFRTRETLNQANHVRAGSLFVLWAVLAVLLAGCSTESVPDSIGREEGSLAESDSINSPSSDLPPQITSLRLIPLRPQPGELVQAFVELEKPGERTVDLDFAWSISGNPVRARSDAVRFPSARKGERIEVRVTATDERGLRSEATAFARVGNRPPVLLGVDLSNGARSGSAVAFETSVKSHDPDGDDLRFLYEWRVNDRRVPGRVSFLEGEGLRRGDEIKVVVIADDGDDQSDPVVSRVARVGNSPPEITSSPNNQSANGSFFYQVQAEDPDLDRGLIYSLVESPKGMTIGRLGGELVWDPGSDQDGVHAVTIRVEDRHGGSALQTFELTIGDQEPSQKLAAAKS
jgi:hypothetical protein